MLLAVTIVLLEVAPLVPVHRLGVTLEICSAPMEIEATGGKIHCEPVRPARALSFLSRVSRELALYSPGIMRKARLKRIVLCTGLRFRDDLRFAIPDFRGTMCFDVMRGSFIRGYHEFCIHHELFHVFDWFDDHELYEDPSWTALNPTGFRYDPKHLSTPWGVRSFRKGFVSAYSLAGVEEDKAEVYAMMIKQPRRLARFATKDAVIAAKAARMRTLLAEFSPEFGEAFWRRAAPLGD